VVKSWDIYLLDPCVIMSLRRDTILSIKGHNGDYESRAQRHGSCFRQ